MRGECDFKKGHAHLYKRPEITYCFIKENRSKFPVEKMCNVFNVSRSGFYPYLKRSKSERIKRKKRLTQRIVQIFESSRKFYGSPKITRLLNRQGERVAQKTVASIMRENQLRSRIVRKYKATTNSSHDHPVHDNRLHQTFIAERLGQVYM